MEALTHFANTCKHKFVILFVNSFTAVVTVCSHSSVSDVASVGGAVDDRWCGGVCWG